jgi:hypothetical protein
MPVMSNLLLCRRFLLQGNKSITQNFFFTLAGSGGSWGWSVGRGPMSRPSNVWHRHAARYDTVPTKLLGTPPFFQCILMALRVLEKMQ